MKPKQNVIKAEVRTGLFGNMLSTKPQVGIYIKNKLGAGVKSSAVKTEFMSSVPSTRIRQLLIANRSVPGE